MTNQIIPTADSDCGADRPPRRTAEASPNWSTHPHDRRHRLAGGW